MSSKQMRAWTMPIILLLGCVPALRAQDSGEAPRPALGGDNIAALQSNVADVPDTRALAGVQNLSLGSQSSSHSFLLPSFGVTTAAQFTPDNSSPGNQSPASSTFISGRLALNKVSGRSQLLLDYLAGAGFSSYSNQSSSAIQNLDFSESIRGGRWSFTFGEQFSYLPASSFNFGGLGGLGNFGVNLGAVGVTPGFRQDLIPNQSILTRGAARISNATMAQTTYALGYRSSISVFGTYGNLHFRDSGFQNSSSENAGVGYNYLLSPLNSMSVSYAFSRFTFAVQPFQADSHSAQLSFARRVTGRLSFQIGAGPDVQVYQSRLAGPGSLLSWTLNTGLNYQLRDWRTAFSYTHSLTGGSGILAGAESDVFSGHLGRTLRSWQTGLAAGYARNHAIQQFALNVITPQSWFAGAQVSHQFAGFGSLFISYNVSRQLGLNGICPPAVCGTGLTQTVSVGYNWGFRPIVLE